MRLERDLSPREADHAVAHRLERRVSAATDAARAWILVNKKTEEGFEVRLPPEATQGTRIHRVCRDEAPEEGEPTPEQLPLAGAEVVYVLPQ